MKNKIWIICLIIVIALIAGVCYGFYAKANENIQNPVVTIEVENFGTIKVELYPDIAPNTVKNFIALANNGYYNGKTFHRTIPTFMIQGGDKLGDGTGGVSLSDLKEGNSDEEYSIKGEFLANGFKNTLKHEKGVISMARSDYSSLGLTEEGYNSAGAQFFIMNETNASLDGMYAGFGKVIEGLEIVDKIANVEVTYREDNLAEGEEAPKDENGNEIPSDKPINPPVMTNVAVETFGVDYGMPKTEVPFDYNEWMNEYLTQYYTGE